jgi:hypothetical protein
MKEFKESEKIMFKVVAVMVIFFITACSIAFILQSWKNGI